jgi:DNA-directed RNA polymerase subunit RPC12/RpoP
MNRCPSCGKTAMPVWKKTLIGTHTRIRCRSCGAEVSIAPLEILWALPLAVAVAVSFATSDVTAKALLWTAGLVLGTIVKGALVPLIRSSKGREARAVRESR